MKGRQNNKLFQSKVVFKTGFCVVASKAAYIILKMIKNLRHQFKDSARKFKSSSDVKHIQKYSFLNSPNYFSAKLFQSKLLIMTGSCSCLYEAQNN